jgi:nucleoporin POM152
VPENAASQSTNSPLIPSEAIDVPTQRFYISIFYVALTAWRLSNAYTVVDDLDSTWLFLKWTAIDVCFLAALPMFRIPWLQFSFVTLVTLWLVHVVANAFLMYKIPIPLLTWFGALGKLVYDSGEQSLSGPKVKPANILQNSSIILGKQIIHILPEGSAILNPEKKAFCLDAFSTVAELPIHINQTTPILIELKRYDLDTDEAELIVINSKETKHMKKKADSESHGLGLNTPRILHYAVKKTGLYQLDRVIDTTNLEVRHRSFDVAVVPCPKASISSNSVNRCSGELSSVSLQVEGVPPFKVKYSKTVNGKQFSSNAQNVQPSPDGYVSIDDASNVVLDPRKPHVGWTRSTLESFEINESLHQNGTHSYTVEAVEDGLGNKVSYDSPNPKDLYAPRIQSLVVHNRPQVRLHDCSPDRLIPLPTGKSTPLPVRVQDSTKLHPSDWPLTLKYSFIPETNQEIPQSQEFTHEMTDDRTGPQITKAGRYNIDSIAGQFCPGEVLEPSSCTLFNPPGPDISVAREDIFDKCAGNPIGMILNLDFTGTAPFKVMYTVAREGKARPQVKEFSTMRGQIELLEQSAGTYTYTINQISDSVYEPASLRDRDLVFQQTIRPPASAVFQSSQTVVKACLGQPISETVKLLGEGPWDLEYEIIHGGKRKKRNAQSETDLLTIEIPGQTDGGRYTLMLASVQDKSRCKTALKEERHIDVRPDQPTAAFGDIQGKRSVLALDGKEVKIPLRLKGNAPWAVRFQMSDDPSSSIEQHFRQPNSFFTVNKPGNYEIVSVHDQCSGFVDPKANQFEVNWIPRPSLQVKDPASTQDGMGSLRKSPVCQGDESALALALTGTPPFSVKYQQKYEPAKGAASISNKENNFAGSNALINLDTTKSGEYTYVFSELGDERYAHDKKRFSPIVVKQQVFAPPSAKFGQPGKTYSYCQDDPSFTSQGAETENIPITLTGVPPFNIEIAITHHGQSPRPEIIRQKDIQSNSYSWPLSRTTLDLGTHSIAIRSVKDSRGCESSLESDPSSVRVQVSSPPTISPLQSQENFCVGEHVSFSLSGQPPFEVFYTFEGRERKATQKTNEFKRLTDLPGEFVITGISDSAMGKGKCRARKEIKKVIRPFPTVEIGRGKTLISDIHEGGEVEILFSFTGTPPFEFT